MLKNIMKAGLIAAMVLGTSSVATADVKVGARYGMYFGQLDPGETGKTARFQTYGESGLIVKGSAGKASFTLHPEFRTGDTMQEDADEFYDVEVYGSYVTPVGLVSIGTVRNAIAYGTTTAGGGVKASKGGLGAQLAPTLAGATEGDGVQLLLPLMNKQLLIQATMYDKALVKFRTLTSQLKQATGGTTQAVGARYMMGPLTLAFGMTNETVDDYDSAADTAETNTYSQFSAGYKLGNMTFNIASVSSAIKGVDKTALNSALTQLASYPSEIKVGVTALGFQMTDLGPGKLNFNYEAMKMEDTNSTPAAIATALTNAGAGAVVDMSKEVTAMSLFYSIDVSPGVGYQIVYDSKAATPEGGDTTTKTYLGVALYGRF